MVRFNPNLYANGKVCLSLLGTWSGPSWNPASSTLLQVLVSIQSLIMVADPYFNEPGYESLLGTKRGKQLSHDYNSTISCHTLRFAVLQQLRTPSKVFEDVLKTHFTLKRNEILLQCHKWKETYRTRESEIVLLEQLIKNHLDILAGVRKKQSTHLSENVVDISRTNNDCNVFQVNDDEVKPSMSIHPIEVLDLSGTPSTQTLTQEDKTMVLTPESSIPSQSTTSYFPSQNTSSSSFPEIIDIE